MKRFAYTLSVIIIWGQTICAMQNYARPLPHGSFAPPPIVSGTLINRERNVLLSKDLKRMLKLTNSEEVAVFIDERPYPRNCKREVPKFPLNAALTMKNKAMLKEFYSNWHGGLHLLSEFHQSIAETLQQVAQLPADPSDDIIPFLLRNLDPSYIDPIDCLLESALDNGHLAIIEYFHNKLNIGYLALALHDACKKNKVNHVEHLLNVGVSPELGIGQQDIAQLIVHDDVDFVAELSPYAHYPLHHAIDLGHASIVQSLLAHKANPQRLNHRKITPLNTALRAFKAGESLEVSSNRVSIIEALLEALPDHGRPLSVELNLITVPPDFRERILVTARRLGPQPPAHITMSEDFTLEELQKFEKKAAIVSALCIPPCIAAGIYAAKCISSKVKESQEEKQVKVAPIIMQKRKNVRNKHNK